MRIVAAGVLVTVAVLAGGCNGGKPGSAAETEIPKKNPIAAAPQPGAPEPAPAVDVAKELKQISPAIPIYADAKYRDDLTRRDSVMIRNQYGPKSEVYTLATDDSFPAVYHYYTTYLSQFRAYAAPPPYPAPQNWRTLEVNLNDAMQDPFIPGDTIKPGGPHVTLQVAETEAEPKTVIRYIITPETIAHAPAATQ
jgi:hypothetical protein